MTYYQPKKSTDPNLTWGDVRRRWLKLFMDVSGITARNINLDTEKHKKPKPVIEPYIPKPKKEPEVIGGYGISKTYQK